MFKHVKGKPYVKTFDGFDLYWEGKMVYLTSAKSKELLAYLVNQKGEPVTISSLAQVLFDNTKDPLKAKRSVHQAYERLVKQLREQGIENFIVRDKGLYFVDIDKIICDRYEMENGRKGISNYFSGEYMPEYSWAESILPLLLDQYYQDLG